MYCANVSLTILRLNILKKHKLITILVFKKK